MSSISYDSGPDPKPDGSYTILVKPDCYQASWERPSRLYTYAGAAILAEAVLVRVEASDLHQKCGRTNNMAYFCHNWALGHIKCVCLLKGERGHFLTHKPSVTKM